MCDEVTAIENQLHPDKIIAEIVHLPQARTGNILYRNFKREYEIPYLGNASVDRDHQIQIDDLYVSVKAGKVILRSKRLNKETIPRLSNAHNFGSNALPIYHFLCDLQDQNSFGFGFSWGGLQDEFDFLPRLNYKEVVLSRATWNINKEAIDKILASPETKAVQTVREFQATRNIADIVYLTQGDNEVLINFKNDLSCMVFYFMLKGERFIQLKEFLFTEDTITGNYCNEIIISAHKTFRFLKPFCRKVFMFQKKTNSKRKLLFQLGKKWLYYKFYCGERAGEELLNRAINPIVAQLEAKGLIEKWFFIRYHDAYGHHLRFRVLLKDVNAFTDCLQIVKQHIEPFEATKIIWKTQTDTYLREAQRYGFQAIEDTETLFYNDSNCTLQFADMIEGDSGEKVRWLFALLSMDHFLDDFGIGLEGRVKLFNVAKTSFGKEFNRTGKLNKQINELFAKHQYEVGTFLDRDNIDEMYEPLFDILKERSQNNTEAIQNIKALEANQELPTPLYNLILSYLHMICNRVFLSKHRIHEMVVYDYMYKYYSKQLFTNKQPKEAVELTNEAI